MSTWAKSVSPSPPEARFDESVDEVASRSRQDGRLHALASARGVNHGLATLRKLRWSGGSISMIVRIAPMPCERSTSTVSRLCVIPG